MLDVAIGIIFIYLLLSLVCSAMNEIIEGLLKKRAADLARAIRELLRDPQGTGLAKELYNHPLIFGLFKGNYEGRANHYKYFGKNLPSYIPARNFALALLDVISPSTATTPGGASGATTVPAQPVVVPASASLIPTPSPPIALAPLRASITKIANPNVQKALLTLVDAAGNDVDKARENIEAWYNSAMDRVSGWYKRRVQYISLLLGFGIALSINADTITIFSSLVNERPLRDAIVASIVQKEGQAQMPNADEVQKTLESYRALGLPMGWKNGSPFVGAGEKEENILLKIIGWLITAFAITLGAPFWFDLLNKFMVIRSTVKPREKSQEEASEDRQQ